MHSGTSTRRVQKETDIKQGCGEGDGQTLETLLKDSEFVLGQNLAWCTDKHTGARQPQHHHLRKA